MDEARRMALEGVSEGCIVQADEQSAGRGRFGNQWSSPPGNLYMTLILRPRVDTRFCAQISFLVAVALGDTLKALGVPERDIALKWPNDVLAGGKKIAGILLEMQSVSPGPPDFLLAGVGVNVAVAPEGRASIHHYNPQADVMQVRDALMARMGMLYDRWLERGFSDIRAAWLERAHGLGMPITARMADRSVDGVFDGVDDEGNLMLRSPSGQRQTIHSGAVHFRPSEG
jgi:BirA family biotin operon repressor/biotin-[acetyl-CoA-carboxylase] ligase